MLAKPVTTPIMAMPPCVSFGKIFAFSAIAPVPPKPPCSVGAPVPPVPPRSASMPVPPVPPICAVMPVPPKPPLAGAPVPPMPPSIVFGLTKEAVEQTPSSASTCILLNSINDAQISLMGSLVFICYTLKLGSDVSCCVFACIGS